MQVAPLGSDRAVSYRSAGVRTCLRPPRRGGVGPHSAQVLGLLAADSRVRHCMLGGANGGRHGVWGPGKAGHWVVPCLSPSSQGNVGWSPAGRLAGGMLVDGGLHPGRAHGGSFPPPPAAWGVWCGVRTGRVQGGSSGVVVLSPCLAGAHACAGVAAHVVASSVGRGLAPQFLVCSLSCTCVALAAAVHSTRGGYPPAVPCRV